MSHTNGFGFDERVAVVAGAVAGAIPGGLIVFLLGGEQSMRYFAWLVGSESMAAAWTVWLGLGLAFGGVFGVWLSRSVNAFTNTIIMVSRRSRVTQKLLVPLLHRSALGLTAWAMGLVFGNVVAFGFFAYLLPGIVFLNGFTTPMYPLADVYAIVGYLVYASVMGGTYGFLLEQTWYRPGAWVDLPSPTPAGEGTGIVGATVAGVVAGLFALVGDAGWLFDGFAWAVGLQGTAAGFVLWLLAALLLGLPFVAAVARSLDRLSASLADSVPTVEPLARTVTAGGLGLGYGLALGAVLVAVTAVVPGFPSAGLPGLSTAAMYGLVLGLHTGFVREPFDVELGLPEDIEAPDDGDQPSQPEQNAFAAWRMRRPFAGAMLLMLSGLIVAAIPIRLQSFALTAGQSPESFGIVFGAMLLACGLFALVKPSLASVIGVTGIAVSILSLYGAFGGLVIGMLVGIVGGNLCIAWQPPVTEEETEPQDRFEWLGSSERKQWES